MVCATCAAHGIYNIAEEIHKLLNDVDNLKIKVNFFLENLLQELCYL